MKNKRFTKQDWLDLGLQLVGEDGPESLILTSLCKKAQRTVGSFYHHFKDHDDFLKELMQHWQKTHTQDIIAQVDAFDDTHKSAGLNKLALALDYGIETAIRRLAQNNQISAKIVHETDAIRIDYLTKIYVQSAGLPHDHARELAQIEYAGFVGAQIVYRGEDPGLFNALSQRFSEMIQDHLKQNKAN